jgi:hypothetical protein
MSVDVCIAALSRIHALQAGTFMLGIEVLTGVHPWFLSRGGARYGISG